MLSPRLIVPMLVLIPVIMTGCQRKSADPVTSAAAPATSGSSVVAKTAEALNPLSSAKDQIGVAMDKFLGVRSYHAQMQASSSRGAMAMEMDFVAPDRYRMKAPTGTQYIIGDNMYLTVSGRTMKVALPKGQLSSYRDPARFAEQRASMTVESQGSDTVDGLSATRYLLRNAQPKPTETTMWVGAEGYPLKIEVNAGPGGENAHTTIRYSRFNDPTIRVDAPSGGS